MIPNSVTRIAAQAFSGCGGLTGVTIPESVKEIGIGAFMGCGGLTDVTISEGVAEIGKSAFFGCGGLARVTIPGSVKRIDTNTFYDCDGLTDVTIFEGVTEIGESAFSSCSKLTQIEIPGSVKSIGNYAFAWCDALADVTMDVGVESIGDFAFCDCAGLSDMTIPQGVKSISYGAFYGWNRLERMTIPGSVTNLEYSYGCNHLRTVYVYAREDIASVRAKMAGAGFDVGKIAFGVLGAEPIPALGGSATMVDVAAALTYSVDGRLAANVTDAATYGDYRAWAQSVKGSDGSPAGTEAVKACPNAWLSYALNTATLIEGGLQDGDVKVEEFKPTAGAFDLTVSIRNITVGDGATAANLTKVVSVVGGETLDSFETGNVEIVLAAPVDGKVRLSVKPTVAAPRSFFMKVMVKQ